MGIYILRRLALIIPTLVGIMLLNFIIVQAAPGGPVEQLIAEMEGHGGSALARAGGGDTGGEVATGSSDSRGSRGLPPELLQEIEAMYGFDKPAHERFLMMLKDYATFDFGESFFRDRTVIELII
ncbi:MAG TPA: microcin ABC transporter permease, partial [Marinobacter sp.]|nr:microcin ABC transporter permease [Marinobacter sp.]